MNKQVIYRMNSELKKELEGGIIRIPKNQQGNFKFEFTPLTTNLVSGSTEFDFIEQDDLKIEINEVLKKLTPREKEVIELYYGLNGNINYELEDIGEMLDLTRERCRQIKNKGINRLRKVGRKLNELL
jgi:RNA polymerase sigma factor (sigma-70 family)